MTETILRPCSGLDVYVGEGPEGPAVLVGLVARWSRSVGPVDQNSPSQAKNKMIDHGFSISSSVVQREVGRATIWMRTAAAIRI
jgi:hypothetical protein